MSNATDTTWGIIGFGAAGSAFAEHISALPGHRVMINDPLLRGASPPDSIHRKLEQIRVTFVPEIAGPTARCDVVLSLVTASVARDIAAEATSAWKSGLFIDLNSSSPIEKQRSAELFHLKTAYVDGAILGSIAGEGVKAPLALAGPR